MAQAKKKPVMDEDSVKATLPLPQATLAAFVSDDVTRQTLQPVLAERGWTRDQQVEEGGVNTAIASIAQNGCPQMLVVDLADSEDPRADIQALADVCEPGTLVLALGTANDVTLYRDLIHAGVQDYLLKPLSQQDLADAMDMMIANFAALQAPSVDLSPDAQRIIAVIGVRGGIGASTLVCNLGYALATRDHPAVILDLDLNFGTTAMQFDLEPGRGLVDGLENPARVDGLFLDRALVRPSEHLSLLAAEAPVGGYQPIVEGAGGQLLAALKENFPTIIVDMPRSVLNNRTDVLDAATDIVLLTDYSLTAARDCIRLLGHLRTQNPDAKVHVMLSHNGMNAAEVGREDFINSIESSIIAEIPQDPKSFLAASQKARTVMEVLPGSKSAQAIKKLAERLQTGGDNQDANKKHGWLKKLMKG